MGGKKERGGGGWRGSTSSTVLILGASCKLLPPTRSWLVSPPAVVASSDSLWQPRLTLIRLAGVQEPHVERAGTLHKHQKRSFGASHLPKRFSIIGRKELIINNNFAPARVKNTWYIYKPLWGGSDLLHKKKKSLAEWKMYPGHLLQTHSMTKTVSPPCDGVIEADLGGKKNPTHTT